MFSPIIIIIIIIISIIIIIITIIIPVALFGKHQLTQNINGKHYNGKHMEACAKRHYFWYNSNP